MAPSQRSLRLAQTPLRSLLGLSAFFLAARTLTVFVGLPRTTSGLQVKSLLMHTAYICDDPNALFQIQADAAVAQTLMHSNCAVNQTAPDTANGNSRISLDVATANTTATIAFKIVDFVDAPGSTVGDAFTDVIVKFNPSSHAYTAGLGL